MSDYSQSITVSFDPSPLRDTWHQSNLVAGFTNPGSITIIGNTPTTSGKLSEQNWRDWLKSIPDPVEVV